MNRRPCCLLFLLSAVSFCALPVAAQTKANSTKNQRSRAIPAPASSSALRFMGGVGIGALILGGALGFALGKARRTPRQTTSAPDLFDEMPFPLAYVDESEKITRRNAAFARYLGSEGNFPELFHPDDLKLARADLHQILGGDKPNFSRLCRFFGEDGAPKSAVLSGQKSQRNAPVLIALRDASAQASAQAELVGARQAISALYSVIAGDKSRDLGGKIKSLLAMGCGRFELPTGVLGQFRGDHLETLWVQSEDRRVRPALTLSRSDKSSEAALLGLDALPDKSNWRNHPFLTKNEGIAYFGAPVVTENELFGMLSFSGFGAREKPFETGEIELLQLMADWVGGEIERENIRNSLEKQRQSLLEANQKLETLATHDALTGIKNRRAFGEKLDEEWSRARRYGTPLSLVMLDVDKFKAFNDSFGHPAGDEVLKRVARVLMSAVRATDFLARYGGEEFVLILPNTDAEGAMILAQRLRQKIESATWKERQITASLGVSTLSMRHKSAADLLSAADGALYESKEVGRNRVTLARDVESEVEAADGQ